MTEVKKIMRDLGPGQPKDGQPTRKFATVDKNLASAWAHAAARDVRTPGGVVELTLPQVEQRIEDLSNLPEHRETLHALEYGRMKLREEIRGAGLSVPKRDKKPQSNVQQSAML